MTLDAAAGKIPSMNKRMIQGLCALALLVFATAWLWASALFEAPISPDPERNLCNFENGRLCKPCVDVASCPQKDQGWLCCSPDGVCVSTTIQGACNLGVKGYCKNYSTDTDGSITCHDAPP